jgi:16S rRNA (cytidine1402-2'-O)-methyltransferase
MGTLFVVATPIGNLDDFSVRAVKTLQEVSLIAAEDTRHSRRLLDRYGIDTPLLSYHQHNQRHRRERLLAALTAGDVALITDAGTPAISDPGADLVAAALEAGHRVSPVPGPSALAAAVSASGLVDGPFVFLGFLPRPTKSRRQSLSRVAATGFPFAVFESSKRVRATLGELRQVLGNRRAVLLRELTKLHEEVRSGTIESLLADAEAAPLRGEVVLVVAGGDAPVVSEWEPHQIVAELRRVGFSPSQTAKEAAAMTGLPRSELYEIALRLAESSVGLEGELPLSNENTLQDAFGDEKRPDRRNAGADERERDPGHRHETDVHADVDEGLEEKNAGNP